MTVDTELSPRPNSEVCDYELQKLSWFWVRQLRLADPKLDWEKLKRAMFEGLLLNTPPDNNSNVKAKKLLLDSSWKTNSFGETMQFTHGNNATPTSLPIPSDQYF
ncbi:hypothetical protein A2U01_0043663, partial [Trifolium medium]|nr:hypothetical protein [Trifolium medium]